MSDISWLGPSIDVRPLFASQHAAFIGLLSALAPAQWAQRTSCPGWDVKDVAAHVLGDHLGRLSRHRDGYCSPRPHEGEALAAFLDRLNGEWVIAARRSDAIGQAGLMSSDYAGPVIDTFMRALPRTLRSVAVPEGTALQMTVTGPGAGEWVCTRGPDRWSLRCEAHPEPAARVEIDTDTAWRLCTRDITPQTAAGRARIDGDRYLATAALQIVSMSHQVAVSRSARSSRWAPAAPSACATWRPIRPSSTRSRGGSSPGISLGGGRPSPTPP